MDEIISVILLLFIGGGGISYMPGGVKFLNTGLVVSMHYASMRNIK
jgi:hypothetical protein